LFPQP